MTDVAVAQCLVHVILETVQGFSALCLFVCDIAYEAYLYRDVSAMCDSLFVLLTLLKMIQTAKGNEDTNLIRSAIGLNRVSLEQLASHICEGVRAHGAIAALGSANIQGAWPFEENETEEVRTIASHWREVSSHVLPGSS
jgi:hypothetical protein